MFALHADAEEGLGGVFLDTLFEFLPVLLILFLSYLLMEWMEHKMGARAERAVSKAGWFSPAVGGLLGCVPQCGFSAAAAGLYAGRVISLGTLYAVFLATSDEMLPVMLSAAWQGDFAPWSILRVLGGKLVLGILWGMLIDLAFRLLRRRKAAVQTGGDAPHTEAPSDGGDRANDHAADHEHEHNHGHDHDHEHGHAHVGQIHELCERTGCHCEEGILRSALRHTVKIGIFLFVFSLALNLLFHFVGEDALAGFLSGRGALTYVLSALVGLIPNCAASVAITELYLAGALSVGALYAGLLPAAGVGLLVLCRLNRPRRESVLVILGLLAVGILTGVIIDLCHLNFLGLVFR